MEKDLKNEKDEYLSNHWSDLLQIWNLGLGDQLESHQILTKSAKGTPAFTIVCVCLCVCLATKDKLAKQNVEYLSNHWSDLLQIWNLGLGDQAKC